MNPQLTAGLAVLEEIVDDLLALLRQAEEASLDWRPPIADANSTAALVQHIAGSTTMWLSRALDEPVARDRDAEFRFSGSRDELIAILNSLRERYRDQFVRLEAVDFNAMRQYARTSRPDQTEFTVAWCIQHALVHTSEHWGQIQLNQQLFAGQ